MKLAWVMVKNEGGQNGKLKNKIGKKESGVMYTLIKKRRYSSHTFRYGYLVTT